MNRRHLLTAGMGLMTTPLLARAGDGRFEVEGTVARGFESVREAFRSAQAMDVGGAQLCIYHHGRRVVDLWAGRDVVKNRPYTADTVTILMSGSKGVAASAVHLLVRRGLLDLDAPVARYWPEFAQNGKAQMTVATMMAHKGGLFVFPPAAAIDSAALLDWQRCTDALAAMAPLWPPGTAYSYHAITFGYLVGELVRRVTGKSLGEFIAAEFCRPLGLRMWLGDLPAAEERTFAPEFQSPKPRDDPGLAPLLKMLTARADEPIVKATIASFPIIANLADQLNERDAHLHEIPAANCIANARSLAKLYAALIGPVDGVRLLDTATVNTARTLQTGGVPLPTPFDEVPVKHRLRFGVGYELPRSNVAMLGPGSFGHTGAGGRLGFAHPEKGIGAAYVCNNMTWDATNGTDPRWSWTEALGRSV